MEGTKDNGINSDYGDTGYHSGTDNIMEGTKDNGISSDHGDTEYHSGTDNIMEGTNNNGINSDYGDTEYHGNHDHDWLTDYRCNESYISDESLLDALVHTCNGKNTEYSCVNNDHGDANYIGREPDHLQ